MHREITGEGMLRLCNDIAFLILQNDFITLNNLMLSDVLRYLMINHRLHLKIVQLC